MEFSSTLGYDVVASAGKSRDAVRTIDLDDGLVRVLAHQRRMQAEEGVAVTDGAGHVFTKRSGGPYHPSSLGTSAGSPQSSGCPA